MSTTNTAVATIAIVTVGQWTKGQGVGIKVIIGGTVYVVLLAGMEGSAPDVAQKFALLVLISAVFIYAVPIFQSLGLLDKNKKPKKPKKDTRP